MKLIVTALLLWSLFRIILLLPFLIKYSYHVLSGGERREIEERQNKAIDRRIALMHASIEKEKADFAPYRQSLVEKGYEQSFIDGITRLHESRIRTTRSHCDSDIGKIKKSYWGYIE